MVRKERVRALAAIGMPMVIAGLLLLGICGGTSLHARDAAVSPTFYDWEENSRAAFGWATPESYSNSVQVTRVAWQRKTGVARTFEYMTGGRAGIADADVLASARLIHPPDRLLAKHQEGKVLVRIWGEGQIAGNADEFGLRTAKAVHLATTQVWPREPIPVQADVYVMPVNAAYSFARKVRWKSGHPLELAIFIPGAEDLEGVQIVVAHELYHLLAAFMRVGSWKADGTERPNAFHAFEEIAATSFASCGVLLADGYLPRPRKERSTLVLNGVPMKAPLSAGETKRLIGALRYADAHSDAHSLRGLGTNIGGFLDTMPVFKVLGSAQERIELHSPQGEQLLEMCREFSSDPLKIERWLDSQGEEQTDMTPPSDLSPPPKD